MQTVIRALSRHAAGQPSHQALSDGRRSIDYGGLHRAVATCAAEWRTRTTAPVALALDNGPAWVIADLAALAARLPCVPVPGFFSPAQQGHAIRDAGAGWLVTDRPEFYRELLETQHIAAEDAGIADLAGWRVSQFRLREERPPRLPSGTAKITYTSGTTGAPKGVCLNGAAMSAVATSLAGACRLTQTDRHVGLLPLSTLLENVAGPYAYLIAGGSCVLPPQRSAGTAEATRTPADAMLDTLRRESATTTIMIPQMLRDLTAAIEAGAQAPGRLRFLAVGGAHVSKTLLARARDAGLPVFEGYGLSECASVVALNTPQADRAGSAGRPLPHVELQRADDGEILVRGATLLGYAGESAAAPDWWHTGDLGHVDADGFLYVTGRKKNIFITSYGRNVAPEWVESELVAQPAIAQAWVHGEGRPWNVAIISPREHASAQSVSNAIAATNRGLPDYAQVRNWLPAHGPFTTARGEITANGRLRRDVLAARYARLIEQHYLENACDVS